MAACIDSPPHDRRGPGPARDGPQPAHRARHADQTIVRSPFQELVLTGIDDHQIRFVTQQLFRQYRHAIAGVADASGVDNLPLARRIGFGQELSQPPAERGGVVVRSAIGRRTAQTKNAIGSARLLLGETLRIEQGQLIVRGDHLGAATGSTAFHEQGDARRKAHKWILVVPDRPNADDC